MTNHSAFGYLASEFGLTQVAISGLAPDAEPSAEPDVEWDLGLIERAIHGVELPDYAGVPDSGPPAGPPVR